jgi:ribonuclease D
MASYQLIDTPDAFTAAIEVLRRQPSIAFDLEFDSNYRRYGTTMCLIQITTADGENLIIDPLAKLELAPLFAIFEDPDILKIMHSPSEDLRILHGLGCYPAPLWDNETTARVLDYEKTSLSALLEEKLNIVLSGAQQRSNWFQRPLTEAQLTYAAADAAHLHQLKAILDAEAEAKGLMPLVQSEQEFLAQKRIEAPDENMFLKPADVRGLSPWQQHILHALLAERDAMARTRNRPAFQIADAALLRNLVADEEGMSPESAIYKSLQKPYNTTEYSNRLLETYANALRKAETQGLSRSKPRRERNNDYVQADKDALFAPVQVALADKFGIYAARFLLSNGAATDLLHHKKTLTTLGSKVRKEEILAAAEKLGLDMSGYVG